MKPQAEITLVVLAVLAFTTLCLFLASCATAPRGVDVDACPNPMNEAELASGIVQCRALCSSYGRDFAAFTAECRCVCAPARK